MTVVPLALSSPAGKLSVVVASRNGVKIQAVAAALKQAFPGLKHQVAGSDSVSGVPDQPFGDEETLRGAYNRVASIRLPQHEGSLLVAIEGGVGFAAAAPCHAHGQLSAHAGAAAQWQQQDPQRVQQQQPPPQQQQSEQQGQQQQQVEGQVQQLECFAWVVVQAPSGATTHARTASFVLPAAVSELMLREGLELGAADDAVFGRVKSGQGSGTIGQLTGGLITRTSYYEHAVLCALVPLLNPQLYPGFEVHQQQQQ